MFNIFKKKKKTPPQILIECDKNQIKINGLPVSFPIHLNTLIDVFGEPSKKENDLSWHVVWDELGIYASYGTWDNILYINFLLSNNHKLKHYPEKFFSGQIKVDNTEIQDNDFEKFDLIKNKVQRLTYKNETKPYSIHIGKNFEYKEEISKDKYLLKELNEEQIKFKDFGFKLSIIQVLMYDKELIKPKFKLREFTEWYNKRKIDIEEEGYAPIEEVTQYFRDLPIPKSLASEITEIYQDGGNDIYLELIPFAEGTEEFWDIESANDAKQFPNLKKVVLCYAKENILDELKDMGIKAEWL